MKVALFTQCFNNQCVNRFLKYSVKKFIKLKYSDTKIWKVISSPSNLELFHPFCKTNEVINWENSSRRKDKLIYLNGLTYFRDFYHWEENNGYKLYIGTKDGKKSDVEWKIIHNGSHSFLSIEVFSYMSNKYSLTVNYLLFFTIVKPNLKNYLLHVLNGLAWYMDHMEPVKENQFGKHKWYSKMD